MPKRRRNRALIYAMILLPMLGGAPLTVAHGQTAEVRPGAPPLPGAPATPPPAATTAQPPTLFQGDTAPPAAPQSSPEMPAEPPEPSNPLIPIYLKGLQRGLPSHGYHPGPETGKLDPQTQSAILQYQADAGLPQDANSAMGLKRTLDSVNFQYPPILAGQAH